MPMHETELFHLFYANFFSRLFICESPIKSKSRFAKIIRKARAGHGENDVRAVVLRNRLQMHTPTTYFYKNHYETMVLHSIAGSRMIKC